MGMRRKKNLIDSANELADDLRPRIESAMETARDAVDQAREAAGPLLQDAREKAAPLIADARERAAEAREKAAPYIAEGRSLAAEKAGEAREKAVPLLAEGRALATEKAITGRDAAVAKVNELRGIEPEPQKKGGKLKKLVLVGVLAGVGGLVFKKLRGGQGAGDNWQSSYVPAPPPSPAQKTAAGAPADRAEDDAAAATPDEALADAADAPHADTTPDNPAEVVDLKAVADAPTDSASAGESPYGTGSAAPLEDGSAPDASYAVKGNAGSMLFHTTESPSFERTKAEVWFTDAAAAEAAGFKPWNHKQQH
ncbi:sunset domain-containing protein [Nocardioides jensenii]|uniref:sunset domain-containing protein n=1 Tax=Nocardioides jensenii TaxID=1843 RepID=UPI0008377717|nr:hypothetical protein [Nocardioides jensenii]